MLKLEPIVRSVPTTSLLKRSFRSDNGDEAPWSPEVRTVSGFNSFYGSLEVDKESGRWSWKPVNHYKVARNRLTQTITGVKSLVNETAPPVYLWGAEDPDYFWSQFDGVSTHTGATDFGLLANPTKGLPAFFDESTQQPLSQSLPVDLAGLVHRGITTMAPGIRSEMSLLNSLWELKDFKTLPRRVKSVKDLITKIPKDYSKFGTLKNIAKFVSNLTLESEFNLKPLAREVALISSILRTARYELTKLEEGAHKRHVRRFKAYMPDYMADDATAYYDNVPNWFVWPTSIAAHRSVTYPVSQFSMTMEYSYALPPASVLGREIDAVLDVLGVNLNPAIIWNAIPWSFVVDWVIGINRYLEDFKLRQIEPVLTIHRAIASVKIERVVKTSLLLDGTVTPTFEVRESSFRRFLIDPYVVNASLQTSGLSSKELGLTVALGISRS